MVAIQYMMFDTAGHASKHHPLHVEISPRRRIRSTVMGMLALACTACFISFLGSHVSGFLLGLPHGSTQASLRNTARKAAADILDVEDVLNGRIDAKARLLELLEDDTTSRDMLKPEFVSVRGRVNEAISDLEHFASTEDPAYSESLDGNWEVKYCGSYAPGPLNPSPTRELALFLYSGGWTPGNALTSLSGGLLGEAAGLKISGLKVSIKDGRDVDASAQLEVLGSQQQLSYKAELMPLSGQRLNEEIVSVELPGPVNKQELPFDWRRQILVTYLDDDMLIVRDESGVPDVLVRDPTTTPSTPMDSSMSAAAAVSADTNTTSVTSNSTAP